jgi:hypothetical protein
MLAIALFLLFFIDFLNGLIIKIYVRYAHNPRYTLKYPRLAKILRKVSLIGFLRGLETFIMWIAVPVSSVTLGCYFAPAEMLEVFRATSGVLSNLTLLEHGIEIDILMNSPMVSEWVSFWDSILSLYESTVAKMSEKVGSLRLFFEKKLTLENGKSLPSVFWEKIKAFFNPPQEQPEPRDPRPEIAYDEFPEEVLELVHLVARKASELAALQWDREEENIKRAELLMEIAKEFKDFYFIDLPRIK